MSAPRKRRRLPGVLEPHRCVILAVDPSQRSSGWALFLDGELADYGTAPAERFDLVRQVVLQALELGAAHERKVVLVGEEWGTGGRLGSVRTSGGLGAAWGAWKGVALSTTHEGVRIARRRILRVSTATWRAKFRLHARMGSERLKKGAVRLANARLGLELEEGDHDVAEAVLIGVWASRSGEVGAALAPAKRKTVTA